MSLDQRIKIAVGGTAGVAFLLFVLLITYKVITAQTGGSPANATVQMASVYFRQPMDSFSIATLGRDIRSMKGVKNVLYNPRKRMLVFLFDTTQNSARNVYNVAIRGAGYSVFYFRNKERALDSSSIEGLGYTLYDNVVMEAEISFR